MKHPRALPGSRLGAALLVLAVCSASTLGLAAPDPPRASRAVPVAATVEGDQYTVTIDAAVAKVGQPGAIVVAITPKAGFKINEEFPTKLTVESPPDGLSFPSPVLKKADGTLDAQGRFAFRMPFVAARAGAFKVEPTLKFSVCNADRCIVQRQTLAVQVKAE